MVIFTAMLGSAFESMEYKKLELKDYFCSFAWGQNFNISVILFGDKIWYSHWN